MLGAEKLLEIWRMQPVGILASDFFDPGEIADCFRLWQWLASELGQGKFGVLEIPQANEILQARFTTRDLVDRGIDSLPIWAWGIVS